MKISARRKLYSLIYLPSHLGNKT